MGGPRSTRTRTIAAAGNCSASGYGARPVVMARAQARYVPPNWHKSVRRRHLNRDRRAAVLSAEARFVHARSWVCNKPLRFFGTGVPNGVRSQDFYETDPGRGFARGFSIQTVSPLPIGWAEHVLADGHWGRALREYMRDYNHWACIGVLNELLPEPGNRVTLAEDKDAYGLPVARFDYRLTDNDKANVAYSTKVISDILDAAGAQDVLTIHRYAHLVGGARMGSSPADSVVDADHRVWGVPNLFISDGSVCPTQGAANPALTIMALASRLAERMTSGAARLPAGK